MYPIATEKGINEKGKMEYEIFGVKLKEKYAVEEVLKAMGKESLLRDGGPMPLFRIILNENKRNSIFTKHCEKNYYSQNFWPDDISKEDFSFLLELVSVGEYELLIQEILKISKKYFDGNKKPVSRLYISSTLSKYLEVFHEINFKIHRSTEKRIVVGKPAFLNHNTGVAKRNAMALMLLTGETTYFDGTEEKPIIVDGVIRTKKNWKDMGIVTPTTILQVEKNFNIDVSCKKYLYVPNTRYNKKDN